MWLSFLHLLTEKVFSSRDVLKTQALQHLKIVFHGETSPVQRTLVGTFAGRVLFLCICSFQ